jgi:exopolyphosphatase/guanosine-5'-triphosphate,3'-diphosphate pyrophosphatase
MDCDRRPAMMTAAIDIGTNTVLLLIASIDARGQLTALVDEQRSPRLGKGVDESRIISAAALDRLIDVLLEYRALIAGHNVKSLTVTGTSAVRDAANRQDVLRRVHAATGFAISVLSGEDEARLSYRGAVSGLSSGERTVVLDIGGGSTEIIAGEGESILFHTSRDVGAVRLTERFFRHDPPLPEEIQSALSAIRASCADLPPLDETRSRLVGVAGTATTLALLDQGVETFDPAAITNYRLSRQAVDRLFVLLSSKRAQDIRVLSAAMQGRADVITAGTLILRCLIEQFGFAEMIVSERGLRYGAALRAAKN